jgi:hypothetical protein
VEYVAAAAAAVLHQAPAAFLSVWLLFSTIFTIINCTCIVFIVVYHPSRLGIGQSQVQQHHTHHATAATAAAPLLQAAAADADEIFRSLHALVFVAACQLTRSAARQCSVGTADFF